MNTTLTADDLWPLVEKLPRDQQVRLARRVLRETAQAGSDADRYRATPAAAGEFDGEDAAAAWEGDGWEEFYEPG
jgi:hypothetical protein